MTSEKLPPSFLETLFCSEKEISRRDFVKGSLLALGTIVASTALPKTVEAATYSIEEETTLDLQVKLISKALDLINKVAIKAARSKDKSGAKVARDTSIAAHRKALPEQIDALKIALTDIDVANKMLGSILDDLLNKFNDMPSAPRDAVIKKFRKKIPEGLKVDAKGLSNSVALKEIPLDVKVVPYKQDGTLESKFAAFRDYVIQIGEQYVGGGNQKEFFAGISPMQPNFCAAGTMYTIEKAAKKAELPSLPKSYNNSLRVSAIKRTYNKIGALVPIKNVKNGSEKVQAGDVIFWKGEKGSHMCLVTGHNPKTKKFDVINFNWGNKVSDKAIPLKEIEYLGRTGQVIQAVKDKGQSHFVASASPKGSNLSTLYKDPLAYVKSFMNEVTEGIFRS